MGRVEDLDGAFWAGCVGEPVVRSVPHMDGRPRRLHGDARRTIGLTKVSAAAEQDACGVNASEVSPGLVELRGRSKTAMFGGVDG